jgi:uncharacterized integral membrane protein (TIGR00698 family)
MKFVTYINSIAPGILISGLAATIAWFVGPLIPGLNAVIFGLLIGIIIGNLWTPTPTYQAGVSFSSSKILEFAIVMMAFEINIMALSKVGIPILAIVLVALTSILLLTLFLSRKMSCPDANGWLIGFGTAICGSAAISALGPMITKDKAQIGISLAVINILGGLGIFFVPALIPLFGLDATEAGVLVGGSLHSMGHVAGAAALMEDDVRNVAISVKLVRIALLTPALILFSNIINTRQDATAKYSLKLPIYLILFIIISLFVSFIDVSKDLLSLTKSLSNIGLTVAMVGIGMGISFKKLVQSGSKAILFGSIIFLFFLIILLGLIWMLL